MSEYQFAPDETVVLRASEVELAGKESKLGTYSELLLTNQNIVFPKKGLFGKVKDYMVWPLARIRVVGGVPQVRLDSSEFMEYKLDVSFDTETVSFKFKSLENKQEVRAWVNEISRLVTGKDAPEENLRATGVGSFFESESVAESIGNVLGAFEGAFEGQLNKHKRARAQDVAIRCPSCNASLEGRQGTVVECPFCGSYVTIPLG